MATTATKRRTRLQRVNIREDIVRGGEPKVDRDSGVIRGVKILGAESVNGRRYTTEAYKKAIGLYEGASVRLNHPKKATDSRDSGDVFGQLRNVTVKDDGLYGDLHFLKSHPFAERLCEAAERMPLLFGLSHNADGVGETVDGVFVVSEITEVRSVDIVADPATTSGLFEERRPMKLKAFFESIKDLDKKHLAGVRKLFEMGMLDDELEAPPAEEVPAESPDDALWSGFKAAIIAVIDDTGMGAGDKHKKIGELLKAHEKLVGGGEVAAEEEEDEKSKDGEKDGEKKKETKEGEGEDDKEKDKMKEEIRLLKAEKSARALCEAADLLKPSPVLIKALCALDTDAERKSLIEEAKAKTTTTTKPRTSSPNRGAAAAATNGDDYKSFLEAIKN